MNILLSNIFWRKIKMQVTGINLGENGEINKMRQGLIVYSSKKA